MRNLHLSQLLNENKKDCRGVRLRVQSDGRLLAVFFFDPGGLGLPLDQRDVVALCGVREPPKRQRDESRIVQNPKHRNGVGDEFEGEEEVHKRQGDANLGLPVRTSADQELPQTNEVRDSDERMSHGFFLSRLNGRFFRRDKPCVYPCLFIQNGYTQGSSLLTVEKIPIVIILNF